MNFNLFFILLFNPVEQKKKSWIKLGEKYIIKKINNNNIKKNKNETIW